MTRLFRSTAALLLFAGIATLSPQRAALAASDVVVVEDYGIYEAQITGKVRAPKDISGSRNVVGNIRLIRKTRQLAAYPGRSFGFRFRVTDPSLLGKRLILRTRFPKMTNPENGKMSTGQEREFLVSTINTVQYDGYRFDYRWEMAEGMWSFEIIQDGKVLTKQSFKVIVPLN